MDIADEQPLARLIGRFVYSVAHSAGRTVGKGQAQHVVIVDTFFMCIQNSMCKKFRFSASGRRKNKEITAVGFNDLFLAIVENFHG